MCVLAIRIEDPLDVSVQCPVVSQFEISALDGRSRWPSSCGMLSAKQEAKMNWVKCTDMHNRPIYVNIENATSILWNEIDKSSIIAFANIGGDTIEVIEPPEVIIRGE